MKSGVYCPSCSKAHELEYEQVMRGSQFQRVGVCPECEANMSSICASVSRDLGWGSADSLERKRDEYEAMKSEIRLLMLDMEAIRTCDTQKMAIDRAQAAIVRMIQKFVWI